MLIISLVRGIQLSRKSSSRIEGLRETKAKLEEEQKKLIKEREYVQSEYYLEKVARDELHLSKQGETVVIVPEDKLKAPDVINKTEVKTEIPNWMKWWRVLSGRD